MVSMSPISILQRVPTQPRSAATGTSATTAPLLGAISKPSKVAFHESQRARDFSGPFCFKIRHAEMKISVTFRMKVTATLMRSKAMIRCINWQFEPLLQKVENKGWRQHGN